MATGSSPSRPALVQPGVAHAAKNGPNWISLLTLAGMMIPVLAANEWVQHHANWVIGLGTLGGAIGVLGQWLRDKTGSALPTLPGTGDGK